MMSRTKPISPDVLIPAGLRQSIHHHQECQKDGIEDDNKCILNCLFISDYSSTSSPMKELTPGVK
jgi:hypothetical protein